MNLNKLTMILTSILTSVIIIPFINGVGCNFKYTEDYDDYHMVGSCNKGILQTQVTYKNFEFSYYKKFVWASFAGRVYLINITPKISQSEISNYVKDTNLRYEHHKYNETLFTSYLSKRTKSGEYIFITDEPVEAIYIFNIKGSLSFF